MLILGRQKDYYDYLVSKYGVDTKVVLNRETENQIISPLIYDGPNLIRIHFCDIAYEILAYENKFYTIDDVAKTFTPYKIWGLSGYRDGYIVGGRRFELRISPSEINEKMDCPIVMEIGAYDMFIKYPNLGKLGFYKYVDAENAYISLYNWLQKEKPIEEISDRYKISSKGFDIKTSFRGKK